MLGKLSIALLIVASPALAQEAASAEPAEGVPVAEAAPPAPVAYKTKRVCRSIAVVGSKMPRTTCTTKKIPIKPANEDAANEADPSDAEPPKSE